MTKTLSSSLSIFIVNLILLLSKFSTIEARDRDRHVIKFRSPGLYPEGLTWDPASQHFIVAALRRGTFHSISDAGVTETLTLTLTSSASNFPSNPTILGLAVDHRRNRLLAAVNTAESPYLAAFSLQRTAINLLFLSPLPTTSPTSAVANDVAVDPYGDAYVTNSGENFIWKISLNGTASILSNSSLFTHYPVDQTSPYNYCGLNGVVYIAGKNHLLVVQSNTGKMFKVDAVDGTTNSVILPTELTVADGIAVREDGVVFVVSMNDAWMMKSDDSWAQGVVIDKIALEREGFPTSVTVGGGGRVYVIYGYVEEGMKVISQGEEREGFRIEEIASKKESGGDNVWAFVMVGLGLVYFLFWRFQMGQLVKNLDKKHS
ncbi:hypothetical protein RND81_06G248600 [Saponaria officinalis]|uniref:SMP-30/Gluconolactonase/LRE-like region domain-containing protein n=1 Tax=Saponaria officinalis TaxID=3572 RepID=A0AAW1KG37_SAPOF